MAKQEQLFTSAYLEAKGALLAPGKVCQPSRPNVTAVPFTVRTVAPVARAAPGVVLELPGFLGRGRR